MTQRPLILAVRHGESEWNVLFRKYSKPEERYVHPTMFTPDCNITAKGIQQSQEAGKRLAEILENQQQQGNKDMLWIVSPLRRALQTAQHMQSSMATNGFQPTKLRVHKQCSEVMLDSCDIGSLPTKLEKEFPEFDFSLFLNKQECWWPFGQSLDQTWELMKNQQEGGRETEEMVLKRMIEFKQYLRDCSLEYPVIVVVCHSETIWWLTTERTTMVEDNDPNEDDDGVWTGNGEVVDITKYILKSTTLPN